PAASGTSMEDFLRVLETVPDAEPFMPPNSEEFVHMIEAMTAEQQQGAVPGQRAGTAQDTSVTR
ncbi:MAG TPA: hypothetical protein VF314_06045, partial [Actinomycetes bacterium]